MPRQRILLAAAASAVSGARWLASGRGAVRVAAGAVLAMTLLLGPTARPLAAWLGLPMSTASCACPPTSCRCPHGGPADHAGGAVAAGHAEHGAECTRRPSCPTRGGAAAGGAVAGAAVLGGAADQGSHGGAAHASHGPGHGSHRAASHATHPAAAGSRDAAAHPAHHAAAHGPHGAASPPAHHATAHGPHGAASHASHSAHGSQGAACPPPRLAAAHGSHGGGAGRPAGAAPADPAPRVAEHHGSHAAGAHRIHDAPSTIAGAAPADPPPGRCSIASHCGGDEASALGAQAWLRADLDPGTGWAAPAGPGEPSPLAAAARLLDPGRSPESPPPRRIAPIA